MQQIQEQNHRKTVQNQGRDDLQNLVYLILCKRCRLQYVGKTENALHIWMNGHRSDIRTRRTEKTVAVHFCQPDHSMVDLEVGGIEKNP